MCEMCKVQIIFIAKKIYVHNTYRDVIYILNFTNSIISIIIFNIYKCFFSTEITAYKNINMSERRLKMLKWYVQNRIHILNNRNNFLCKYTNKERQIL